MVFLILTDAIDGGKVYINAEAINSILVDSDGDTCVTLSNTSRFVKESPESIIDLLKQSGLTL